MSSEPLQVMTDPIADTLDDMAALGEHWTRNRDKGRMPSAIRAAMILVARDLIAYVEREQQILEAFGGSNG